MSVYYLLQGVSSSTGGVSTAPSTAHPPLLVASPPAPGPGTGTPITNIGLQLTVQAPGGISVGAVVTIVASNDWTLAQGGGNWATLTTMTAAAGTSPVTTILSMVTPYNAYGAYMPTITGAGATVTCTMSA